MGKIKVYGHSDDIVEIEGDLEEELYTYGEETYLAFSNGVIIGIRYAGEWKIDDLHIPRDARMTCVTYGDKDPQLIIINDINAGSGETPEIEKPNDYTDVAVIESGREFSCFLTGTDFYH